MGNSTLVTLYFTVGLGWLGVSLYQLVRAGILERVLERGGWKIQVSLFLTFLAWPLSMLWNLVLHTFPETLGEKFVTIFRREYLDTDRHAALHDQLEQSQPFSSMEEYMNSCRSKFRPGEELAGMVTVCLLRKGHVGKHFNRLDKLTWTTEQSVCQSVGFVICDRKPTHHEGKHRNEASGYEWEDVPRVDEPLDETLPGVDDGSG